MNAGEGDALAGNSGFSWFGVSEGRSSFNRGFTAEEYLLSMEQGASGGGASAIFSFMQSLMDRSDVSTPSPFTSGSQSPILIPPVSMAASAERSLSLSPVVQSVLLQHSNGDVASDQAKQDKTRLDYKSEEYRQLFHLPPEEVLVEDFNCALQKKILLQGHMYLFERYVCFYSNIFGYEKKKIIPLKDVTCVRKAKTAQVFPNAIEITAWGKKHFFASFLSRDEAYRLIVNGWSHHSAYARIYMGSQASLTPQASPGLSPRPAGPAFSETAPTMSGADQQLQPRSLLADGAFGSRDIEEVPSSAAPSVAEEDAEKASSQGLNDRVEADSLLEGVSDESDPTRITACGPQWEVSDREAPELPDVFKTVAEAEFPIDVAEFFRLFLSNEAICFLTMVHTKCGDEDFRCTQWAKHHHFGHARDISFRYPINFVFGPKATYCHEAQRFRVYQNSHLVLESAQQMADIPYGDYFHVQVRWDVQKLVGSGTTGCFLRISLHVPFSKRTLWKSKIEQGTFDGCKEAFSIWIREAHSVLQELASTSSGHSEPLAASREPELVLQSLPGFENSARLFVEPERSVQGFEDSPTRLLSHVGVYSLTFTKVASEAKVLPHPIRARKWLSNEAVTFPAATERTAPEVDDVLERRSGLQHQDHASTSGELYPIRGEVSRALGNMAFHGFGSEVESERQVSTEKMGLQRIWAAWCPASFKSWTQPRLVMFFVIMILLMQVCIMVALARPKGVQYVPAGYPGSSFGSVSGASAGMCSSGSRQEDMSWIEQRARFMRDEVAMAEARLQTMRHDLAVLKMHLQHFQKSNPQIDLDSST